MVNRFWAQKKSHGKLTELAVAYGITSLTRGRRLVLFWKGADFSKLEIPVPLFKLCEPTEEEPWRDFMCVESSFQCLQGFTHDSLTSLGILRIHEVCVECNEQLRELGF